MDFSLQQRIFAKMIGQDVAFYDNAHTGDLTSRLNSDARAVLSPVQLLLSSVVTAGINLVGGLAMCLYTSWRLSMLSFTTIGPIILAYRVYSRWSRRINSEIWGARGDANRRATASIT